METDRKYNLAETGFPSLQGLWMVLPFHPKGEEISRKKLNILLNITRTNMRKAGEGKRQKARKHKEKTGVKEREKNSEKI